MSGSGSSGGSGDDMALNDMIVIYDYPENVEKAEAIIHDIDVRPKQVLVEATIMDVTLKEEMDLGVDWNLLSGVAVTGFPANIMRGTSAAQAQGTFAETAGFANPGSTGLSVGFSANNMQALITALETVTDTTILANPKILAVNKQLGRVQIGKTIGYRGSTTVSTGGVATQGEVQFMDTGTVLVFRPFIGNDGYIRMDIYPQESTAVLNADKVPDKTTAELTANILAKDGETIVIGGLFRDETSTTRNQVPVLGNLPFIGALFRSTADTTNRHEVIVLLTPHIIQEPSQTNGQARADDIRLKRDGARHALQGIDRTRLAEDSYAKAARYYLEGDTEKALFNVKFALMMRPTYLEALRLRERIMAETDPEQFKRMDSVVVENLDEQEAPNWRRY
jgi:type IV pilus assembly protein PilQ